MVHRYTEEQHLFFKTFVPGHTYQEITDAYNEKFSEKITFEKVKSYMGNHRLNNGLTGRFQKGQAPPNKGKKGCCGKGCEKTWFAKGHVPSDHRPVGSERIDSKDGYLWVKVAEPRTWKAKHRVVWESHYGAIPKSHIVIFLDGNRLNCNIENLKMIHRKELLVMNRQSLFSENPELTETGTIIASLTSLRAVRKKKGGNLDER